MSVIISKKISRNKQKIWYYMEWGKGKGQRAASSIFTYTKPKDHLQRNHNKESIATLETKRSQMILDRQAVGSGYIPQHKIKSNFLDYYNEFIKENARTGGRHLQNSCKQFKKFMGKDFISPIEITETVCERFRSYLLQHFNGETPANYFYKFKMVLKAAKKDGYYLQSPAEDIIAKVKPNKKKKEVLEPEEYIKLIKTPCLHYEVKRAFVFCLYTGLRWCDAKPLTWEKIRKDSILFQQTKTSVPVEIPLHPIGRMIVGYGISGRVFKLPTANGANNVLEKWCKDAGLEKHITWHCARLSFSVLLQDKGVNAATVAGMLGHTTTRQVESTYQRYRVQIGRKAIEKLPSMEI